MAFVPNRLKFKNASGAHIVKPMFLELDDTDLRYAQYTLKDYDHTFHNGIVYPSLRRLYVEMGDPTEYEFATTYLDSWVHWKKLSEASFFQEYLPAWREELEVKLRATALHRIKVRASSDEKDSFAADKILLSGGWKRPESKTSAASRVGRPTKEKILLEAERMFRDNTDSDVDFERIMGKPN